jgi:hypothetical protein
MANRPRAADDFATIRQALEKVRREEADALSGKTSKATSSPPSAPPPRAADDFKTIGEGLGKVIREKTEALNRPASLAAPVRPVADTVAAQSERLNAIRLADNMARAVLSLQI